jgi:hypothetical protein
MTAKVILFERTGPTLRRLSSGFAGSDGPGSNDEAPAGWLGFHVANDVLASPRSTAEADAVVDVFRPEPKLRGFKRATLLPVLALPPLERRAVSEEEEERRPG